MFFVSNLVAASIAFAAVIMLMAVGLLLGKGDVRRGCGDPADCECGASEFPDTPSQINESAS